MGQIADVIKYEGDNTTFIWKHPIEDFNSSTQLIVHETQEAIFFMNGQALDLFGPGRYTLETQNIPKVGQLLNLVTGGETPFHCEVYFINKTYQMSVKWGTDTKIQYVEPLYGFPLSIGACGEMCLRVEDSRKCLLKLVGTENYLSQARLVDYFRAFLMTKIKAYVAQSMKTKAINIFELDEQLMVFSENIKELLIPDFAEFGIALEKFFVTRVSKPDGEPQYEKFKELHFRQYADIAEASLEQRVSAIKAQTKAQESVIQSQAMAQGTILQSQAMATKRAQEGYTYQDERGFDVMSEVAKNEGSGSDLRNAAMGIGMGFGVGGAFGTTLNNIASNTLGGLMDPKGINSNVDLTNSNNIPGLVSLKAEENTSKELDNDMLEFKKKLDKLAMMKESNIISQEEFEEQKQQLFKML